MCVCVCVCVIFQCPCCCRWHYLTPFSGGNISVCVCVSSVCVCVCTPCVYACMCIYVCMCMGFPGGASGKDPPANAEDTGNTDSIPGSERSLGVGNGNPLQYSCLENSTDREAGRAVVHRVAKNRTRLSTHTHVHVRTASLSSPPSMAI